MMSDKKVEGTILGIDSNAFSLMGHFGKLAKKQGWTDNDDGKWGAA